MIAFFKDIAQMFKNAYVILANSGKYILLVLLIIGIPRVAIVVFRPGALVFPIEELISMRIDDLFTLIVPLSVNLAFMILGNLIVMGLMIISRKTIDGDDIYLSDVLKNTFCKFPVLIATMIMFYILLVIYSAVVFSSLIFSPFILLISLPFTLLVAVALACMALFFPMIIADRGEWGITSFKRAVRIVFHDAEGWGYLAQCIKMIILFLIWGIIPALLTRALLHVLTSVIYIIPSLATLLAGLAVLQIILELFMAYVTISMIMYYAQLDYDYSD